MRRCQTKDNDLFKWKRRFGFAPTHAVSCTWSATTQMVKSVKSETREIMHDHFQTRLPELKVRRVNDICYMETFFSSAPLLRGFTCWNLFCFIQTGLGMIYLMWHRSQSPTTLPRMITDCGAPTDMKSDNFLFLSLRGSDGLHTWKVCRWRRSTPKPIIQTIILRNNAAER